MLIANTETAFLAGDIHWLHDLIDINQLKQKLRTYAHSNSAWFMSVIYNLTERI